MNPATRDTVRLRAGNRCEYCLLRQDELPFVLFHIEHVVARQHGGDDGLENLALACQQCNLFKGPNLASIDPETGAVCPIFNPRRQRWADHFAQNEFVIRGLSPVGRATVRLLQMNAPERLRLRRSLVE